MADVQKQFIEFDEAIKLKRADENATLAEKRERVQNRIAEGIARQKAEGKKIPAYRFFNQGSYAMRTGVKPVEDDFDIDVGIEFDLNRADHDPVDVKLWVYDAVKNHTKDVEIRRPCVTIWYQQSGEPIYHVDLAVYASAEANSGDMWLATGKEKSAGEKRQWEASDPKGLILRVAERFANEDAKQFRRCIRALKRWKNEQFASGGHAAPKGIAITAAAYHWYSPRSRLDPVSNISRRDDRDAMRALVDVMLARFGREVSADGVLAERLRVDLPVTPRNDLMSRMTDVQMVAFRRKLEELQQALDSSATDPDPHTACETLRKQFGDEFNVPTKEETAEPRAPAIVSSGHSA